jgi:carbon starvation protein
VSTRLGRYLLQELLGAKHAAAGVVMSVATVGIPLVLLLSASPDSYRVFWTLFGTSNQLLAALTLLGITVWLRKQGKRYWYALLPMLFVMAVTLTALSAQIWLGARLALREGWSFRPEILNAGVGTLLLALAAFFIVQGARATWARGGAGGETA